MIQRSGAGARGLRRAIGSGSSRMMAASVSAAVARWKGRAPVAISNSIAPSANWSLLKSVAWPAACSGDMYPTVPSTTPAPVSGRASVACSED